MEFGCCAKIEECKPLARAGADFVELSAADIVAMSDEEFGAARLALRDAGLPCIGFNSFCPGPPMFVGPDFDPGALRSYAVRVCERGARLGIRCFGVGSPGARRLPEGFPKAAADTQMKETLRIICSEAAKYGLDVMYESLNTKMCNYGVDLREACDMVVGLGIPNLYLVLDNYHMILMGERFSMVTEMIPKVRHVHISHWGAMRGYLLPQGRESYTDFLEAILAGGYDGGISIESPPQKDILVEAGESLAMLRDIVAGIRK